MSLAMVKNPNFTGHETFPFRYGWLKKGVDGLLQQPTIFNDDDAIVELGVGKNMVRSIRHWCLATRIFEQDGRVLRVSDFGQRLLGEEGYDPYLEDVGTLWLLHWLLATNTQRATTWFWMFSHWHHSEFTKEGLVDKLTEDLQSSGHPILSKESLRRDVDCFVRTYVPSHATNTLLLEDTLDCPLNELRLITEVDRRTYRFHRDVQNSLPDLIFAYAVQKYWEHPDLATRNSLSYADLAHQPGSPGRIFRLDDNALAARLERLERITDQTFIYDETSGLKQLYRGPRQLVDAWELLDRYYGAGREE